MGAGSEEDPTPSNERTSNSNGDIAEKLDCNSGVWATQNCMEPGIDAFDPDHVRRAEQRVAAETRELLLKAMYSPTYLVEEAEREAAEIERALKVANGFVESKRLDNLESERKRDAIEADCTEIQGLIQILDARLAEFGGSTAAAMQDCLSRYQEEILQLENELEAADNEKTLLCNEIEEVRKQYQEHSKEVHFLESKREQWLELLQTLEDAERKKEALREKQDSAKALQVEQPPATSSRLVDSSSTISRPEVLSAQTKAGVAGQGASGPPSLFPSGGTDHVGHPWSQVSGQQLSWSPVVRGTASSGPIGYAPGRGATGIPGGIAGMSIGSPNKHHPMKTSHHQSWPGRPVGGLHPSHSHGHIAVTSPRLQAQFSARGR
jgi:hypothetical protein